MNLAEGFYDNTKGQTRNSRAFQEAVDRALDLSKCSCHPEHHICGIWNDLGTPDELVEILEGEFALCVDGTADTFHRTRLPQWFSGHESDKIFGAKYDILSQDLAGLNLLIHPPRWLEHTDAESEQTKSLATWIIDKLCTTRGSELPTRAILIVPHISSPDDVGEYAKKKKLIELVKIPASQLKLLAPNAFAVNQPQLTLWPSEVSIFLFINDRSLLYDPIDWVRAKERLRSWCDLHCPNASITHTLDQKFAERILPPRTHASLCTTPFGNGSRTSQTMQQGPAKEDQTGRYRSISQVD